MDTSESSVDPIVKALSENKSLELVDIVKSKYGR